MVFLKDQKLNEDYSPFLLHDSPCVYGCIYFIFSNNLHICTTDVKHYNSNSCNRADGVQMVAEERGQRKEDRAKSKERRAKVSIVEPVFIVSSFEC